MVARSLVIIVSVALVSASLLALALTMSGVGKGLNYANGSLQDNNTANAIAPASSNDSSMNQSAQPNDFKSSTTGLASGDQPAGNNSTAMPTKSEWENWTTFELFEKYPVLENLTSGNNNATNETRTQQSPSPQYNETIVQQGEESRKALQQQNDTTGPSANMTNLTSSAMSPAPLRSNASSLDNGTQGGSDIFASPIINNNINIDIYNNTNAGKDSLRMPTNASSPQQTSTGAVAAEDSRILDQLQNKVNLLNQSITELKKDVINSTGITIHNLVVNKSPTGVSSDNESSYYNSSSGKDSSAFDFTLSKRITGDLEKDDYMVLGHFTQFSTTEGLGQIQLKIPCNDDKEPKVKLLVGSIPDLMELDLGKAITKASVEGSDKDVTLSKGGEYCLYRAELPENTGDAILINDSGGTLHFSKMRYYVTIIDKPG